MIDIDYFWARQKAWVESYKQKLAELNKAGENAQIEVRMIHDGVKPVQHTGEELLNERCREMEEKLKEIDEKSIKKDKLPGILAELAAQNKFGTLGEAVRLVQVLDELKRTHPVHPQISKMGWQREIANRGFRAAIEKIEEILAGGKGPAQNGGPRLPVSFSELES